MLPQVRQEMLGTGHDQEEVVDKEQRPLTAVTQVRDKLSSATMTVI